jgi:ribosomal protein S18
MAFQSEREEIEMKKFVDYKDVEYLKQFTNPHAKIMSKKRTGISAQKQRISLRKQSFVLRKKELPESPRGFRQLLCKVRNICDEPHSSSRRQSFAALYSSVLL